MILSIINTTPNVSGTNSHILTIRVPVLVPKAFNESFTSKSSKGPAIN